MIIKKINLQFMLQNHKHRYFRIMKILITFKLISFHLKIKINKIVPSIRREKLKIIKMIKWLNQNLNNNWIYLLKVLFALLQTHRIDLLHLFLLIHIHHLNIISNNMLINHYNILLMIIYSLHIRMIHQK